MKFVPEAITKTIAHNALLAQKSSPKVLFGVGIVGVVGSTVLACRATLKMDEIVEEAKGKLETAKTLEHPEYSEKDRQRDISLIYFQTSVKVARAYLPAIIVGGMAIGALTYSHTILTRRNVALTAAYSALDKGFREYRARVIDKYGEDEDRNLRYGSREVEVTNEAGKKEMVTRVAPGEPSIYARFFDSYSPNWGKDHDYNMYFLLCQQNWANDCLKARGHVFLNEVYDLLGLDRSSAGSVVGWIHSKNGETDNHISFGVFDGKTQVARDFVNGYEGAILLDFNVDGVIYDQIENPPEDAKWQRY